MSITIKTQICEETKEYNIYFYPYDKRIVSFPSETHEKSIHLSGNTQSFILPVTGKAQNIKLLINSLTRQLRKLSDMDTNLMSVYDNMTLDNVDYIN